MTTTRPSPPRPRRRTRGGHRGGRPCATDQLVTVDDGSLTIGADNPSFPPWFQDAEGAPWDPTGRRPMGYEAAVTAPWSSSSGSARTRCAGSSCRSTTLQAGPKDFDFYVNQVSYLPAREAVDFSDSYYDVEQAVVTLKDSEFADAARWPTSRGEARRPGWDDELRRDRQRGPTDEGPAVFDRNIDAITALKNGQIDGIVVDFPTSLYVTAVQVPNGKIVGRLPAGEELLGFVFEDGNPLRDCVNEAIAALQADGTIEQLQEEWINASAPPVLE